MSTGRNGLRPFSAEKHAIAVPKELMASYKTGDIVVSDENRSKISAIEFARLNNHIKEFRKCIFSNDIYNDIFQIEGVGGINLKSYQNGENLITEELELPFFHEYIMSLDVDTLVNENNIALLGDNNYIKAHIEFNVYIDDFANVVSFDMQLDELSNYVMKFNIPGATDVKLTQISLSYNSSEYIAYRLLAHSLLMSGK